MNFEKYLDLIVRKDMEIEELRANLSKIIMELQCSQLIVDNASKKEKELDRDLRHANDKYNKMTDFCVEFESSFRELTTLVDSFFKKGELAEFREAFIKVVDSNSCKIGKIKLR